jgi:signal transduction histidine kinase
MLESVATTRVAPVQPPAAPHSPQAGGPGPAGPRKATAAARPWRPLATARGRILGWSVLLLAAALAASTVATHLLLVRQLNARVSAELTHEMAEFRTLAARREEPAASRRGSVVDLLRTRTSQAVLENDITLIGLAGGKVAAASNNPAAAFLRHDPALLARWAAVTRGSSGTAQLATGQARYTAIPVRVPGDPVHGVFVATVLTSADMAAINGVTRLQLEAGAAALLLGAALAWLAAGRVLRPVRDTTELARRITEADLAERIPVRGRNEISELAVTFNRMLDRLEAALTTQRRFLADAGHELRTPITIIQGNLDTIEPRTADDTETLAIVSDELTRMSRLVDELHLLARSERPGFLRVAPAGLEDLTRSLAAKARSLDSGRPWLLTQTAHGAAVLDAQRITQAVMQLAANAVAHTPPGTTVELSSAVTGAVLDFTVADHGPGVPEAQRLRIFDRFARLDSRRTNGTGLGLSIVAAIAAAHGGRVSVTGRAGGGAVFRLSIPCVRGTGRAAEETP